MAKYNREFLVPYLQDICSLYLADRRLIQRIHQEESCIVNCKREIYIPKPDKPLYEETEMGCIGYIAIVWTFLYLIAFVATFFTNIPFGGCVAIFLGVVIGVIVLYFSLDASKSAKASNKRKKEKYEKDMAAYNQNVRVADEERNRNLALIPQIQSKISQISKERNTVHELLELSYSANIIPSHYRNIYAAVFLYDWFSTSGADDLDMALNMFVLEEIKAKLDRIIEQQADMILNQQIMIANQERVIANHQESIDMQRQHHSMMQKKIDRLQATAEERLRYEKMAESNTAATAYFALANYLK